MKENKKILHTLSETIPMGIIIYQADRVHYANPAMAAMFGIDDAGQMPGRDLPAFVAEEIRNTVQGYIEMVFRGESIPPVEKQLKRLDGSEFWAELRITPISYKRAPAVLVLLLDISARKQAELHARKSHQHTEAIVATIREALVLLDADLRVITANHSFYTMFKVKPEETERQCIYDLGNRQWNIPKLRMFLEDILLKHTKFENFEVEHNFETIGRKTMLLNARKICNEPCEARMILLAIEDITERKQIEKKLVRLSYYDELTGLPNRRLFADRIRQAIAVLGRKKRHLALLFLDINRFKFINDTLGYDTGDRTLQETAARLRLLLRESDSVARMGSDEFAVLLPDSGTGIAMRVADKVRRSLQEPFVRTGQDIMLSVSIGIAIFPDDGRDAETMLMHADTAMYYAKRYLTHIHFFSSGMEQEIRLRLRMEQDLAKAVEGGHLRLYFQGQHAIRTEGKTGPLPHSQARHQLTDGTIVGMECLIRWRHPELGFISPAEFIPLAEETGLIRPITHWVLTEACMQALVWEKAGIRPGRIGINLSAIQLMQEGLAKEILACISETGAKPDWIEIEVTETAAMTDPEKAIPIIQELVDAGVSIAIDDFGTGYSSLIYLKRLPAESLKIDIAFVRGLPDDAENVAIVRSTIAMAHGLGMQTIAEGVETEAQLEFLRNENCDALQGYLFSRPLPTDEATKHIRRNLKS